MGARIESVGTSRSHRGLLGRGALHLSDEAARRCLDRAGHGADEIDLLVNAGLYKDKNMAEPALASIIQEDIGANPGHPPRRDHHGTFSFDVMNGGCGTISAAHLVDGFVGRGPARLGLIVAGDADPSTSHHFPFPSVAGAVLLVHTDADEGFARFAFRTFPQHADLFEARLSWEPASGHNVVEFHEDPRFGRRCVECATEATTAFLSAMGLGVQEVDLLIASQYPSGFPVDLGGSLGLPPDRIPMARRELAAAHTAGPIAALESAIESGRFVLARHVLFVTVGAGITTAIALYRNARGTADATR